MTTLTNSSIHEKELDSAHFWEETNSLVPNEKFHIIFQASYNRICSFFSNFTDNREVLGKLMKEFFLALHREMKQGRFINKRGLFEIASRILQDRSIGCVAEDETRDFPRGLNQVMDQNSSNNKITNSRQFFQCLQTGVKQTGFDDKIAYVLADLEKIDCEDVAGILGMPVEETKHRLHSQRKLLMEKAKVIYFEGSSA